MSGEPIGVRPDRHLSSGAALSAGARVVGQGRLDACCDQSKGGKGDPHATSLHLATSQTLAGYAVNLYGARRLR
jgi:hypothetical protein